MYEHFPQIVLKIISVLRNVEDKIYIFIFRNILKLLGM